MPRLTAKTVPKRAARPWDATRQGAKVPEDDISEIDVWIGTRIRLRRIELHLTVTRLSLMARVSQFTVERWEAGRVRVVPARLWDLAMHLQVNPGWFFEGFEVDNPRRIETASLISELAGDVTLDIMAAMHALSSPNRQIVRTVANALLATQADEPPTRLTEDKAA